MLKAVLGGKSSFRFEKKMVGGNHIAFLFSSNHSGYLRYASWLDFSPGYLKLGIEDEGWAGQFQAKLIITNPPTSPLNQIRGEIHIKW